MEGEMSDYRCENCNATDMQVGKATDCLVCEFACVQSELAAAQAEIARLRDDAERYRQLRNHPSVIQWNIGAGMNNGGALACYGGSADTDPMHELKRQWLDEAIDEARKA